MKSPDSKLHPPVGSLSAAGLIVRLPIFFVRYVVIMEES